MSLQIVKDPITGKKLYKFKPPNESEYYVFEDSSSSEEEINEKLPEINENADVLDEIDAFLNDDSNDEDIFAVPSSPPKPKPSLKRAKIGEDLCELERNRIKPSGTAAELFEEHEQEMVKCAEQSLRMATWRALQPLYAFVGKVEAMLGGDDVRRHYRWIGKDSSLREQQTPVVSGNRTLTELWENNYHLGPEIIAASLASVAISYLPDEDLSYQRKKVKRTTPFKPPRRKMREQPVPQEDDREEQFFLETDDEKGHNSDVNDLDDIFGGGTFEETANVEQSINNIEKMALGSSRRLNFRIKRNIGRNMFQFKRIGNLTDAVALLPVSESESDILKALVGEENILLHPDWVLCVINEASFQFVLRHSSFGAFELAASELGRLTNFRRIPRRDLLIDLILSPDVSDMFAEFVANKFLTASGGNAYPSMIRGFGNSGFNAKYNVSAGFRTRAERSRWNMGAKYWFQNVMYISNPNIGVTRDTKNMENEKENWVELKFRLAQRFNTIMEKMDDTLTRLAPTIRLLKLPPIVRDRTTRIPVIPGSYTMVANGHPDPNVRDGFKQFIKLQEESRKVHKLILTYTLSIRKREMQIAKIHRERQCHRPSIFIYRNY
jgi:hypothetical protein